MARQKGRHARQSAGITPVRIQGTNTPVNGDQDRDFFRALRIFNKKVADADIIGETKRREYYEKPSVTRKRELAQAKRREQKRQEEANTPQAW